MRILAIDLGDTRTGFAVSDPTGLIATPLSTFVSHDKQKVAERAAELAGQYSAERIVIGLPVNMNNTQGPRAEKSSVFAALLQTLLPDTEIILRDERNTTVTAAGVLNETNTRGKKRRAVIDTVAAAVILQNYLDYLRLNP